MDKRDTLALKNGEREVLAGSNISKGFPLADVGYIFNDLERILATRVESWFSSQKSGLVQIIIAVWLSALGTGVLVISAVVALVAASGAFKIDSYIPFAVGVALGILILIGAWATLPNLGRITHRAKPEPGFPPAPEVLREQRATKIFKSRLEVISSTLATKLNPLRLIGRIARNAAPLIATASLLGGILRRNKVSIDKPPPDKNEPGRANGTLSLKDTLKGQAQSLAYELVGTVLVPIIAGRLISELSKNGSEKETS